MKISPVSVDELTAVVDRLTAATANGTKDLKEPLALTPKPLPRPRERGRTTRS